MRLKRSDFPRWFVFGVATSAYQIEGAVNEDGREHSIWDVFSHINGNIKNNENGDIACDHYHRFEEDISIISELGLDSYRFSIAWPRVVKKDGKKNEKGLDFYNRLVDRLLEKDIIPFVTLYHWDLPYYLYEKGGWLSNDIAYYFRDYAALIFEELGDRVKYWITLNEPWCSSHLGYFMGIHAPGHKNLNEAIKVAHNLLRSHGYAVEAFREIVKDGKIGITNVVTKVEPANEREEDYQFALLVDELINGWFHDPIVFGRYPENAKGFLKRFGIKIYENDMKIISNDIDFFGVNYYTRQLIEYSPENPFMYKQIIGKLPKTEMNWEIYPQGLYDMLKKLYFRYKLPLYITENGMAGPDKLENEIVNDDYRIDYLEQHFKMALKAVNDGVDLRGYFIWTLMDNFEWIEGYSKRFGIIYTDYKTQKRYLKESALWLKEFLSN
ncbi:beta-glucosidase [Thermosipho affectus]|uniref:Beta-glucosidase n=1 Tax=Thermosipho affectus TaxID=660294 RepID=A0ABX3IFF0_9BACT|nr:GH1 family beta-glucosidase [Thermosipho affectus]ONN26551.1 beta-glucosidase [Thermosipho affectus]